ncbi:MAG: M12 family metallo-peptidase [Ferruginibacter sp.]
MKNLKLLVCVFFLMPLTLLAQNKITAIRVNNNTSKSLSSNFKKYSLFNINTANIKASMEAGRTGNTNLILELPQLVSFNLLLHENNILSSSYKLTVASATGKQQFDKPSCMTYAGYLTDDINSAARLTITADFIYGSIRSNNKEYFIEPLKYFAKNADPAVFVLYETADVIFDTSLTCAVTERATALQKMQQPTGTLAGLNCVRTEVAIASDDQMFLRYGSANAVEVHNIGVMNNVIWNYTNAQFNNNIEFVIAGQNVSTTAATNQLTPAYTGTNSNTILNNFRTWGQALNFGFTYDIAQFWTTRNIDNDGAGTNAGIIGLAYVGTVCTSSRYQLLEDFSGLNPSGSGYVLEILTAHETGHNFNASHDTAGSGFIMAPSVTNTHSWSPASIAAIDGHVATRTCLDQCSASNSLVTDFLMAPATTCAGGSIQFTDRTLGGPTAWNWSFEGGTPSTSNSRNPVISFASAGIKNIVLITSNINGANVKSNFVIVSTPPAAACVTTGTGTSNAGINAFSLNNINKVTAGLATDGNKYFDFSCSDNTILLPGTSYTAIANVGTTVPANAFNLIQFFIDYNNDGDFIDAGENVYNSAQCYIGNHQFAFTTPAAPPVLNQLLRARLIAKDCIGGAANACYNPIAGQVEDYGVMFLSTPPACSINYWTGAASAAWENPANWSCGNIPDATTNVIIGPGKPNNPEVKSMATCKSLHNVSGTSIIIFTGFNLDIVGVN